MIRRIEVLNFRCLRYVDLQLDRFHLLIGPNASGKSTLLDSIAFLGDLGVHATKRCGLRVKQNIQYELRKLALYAWCHPMRRSHRNAAALGRSGAGGAIFAACVRRNQRQAQRGWT